MEKANEGDAWDDNEFESCYREFDYDGNGTISKQELTQFIKRFAALWVEVNCLNKYSVYLFLLAANNLIHIHYIFVFNAFIPKIYILSFVFR